MKKIVTAILLFYSTFSVKAQVVAPSQNYVLKFSNSVVFAPVNAKLNLGASFTMAAWVNPTSRDPYALIMGKPASDRSADPFMSYAVGWNSTGDKIEFIQTTGVAGSYRSVTSPNMLPLNTWTHVAATLANGTMRLFINGQEVGNAVSPGTPQVNTVPFGIGGGLDKTTFCCGTRAYIKQVAVWNKGLTATEIQQTAQTIPASNAAGLIAFWKLDESQGQVAKDISINQLDAVLGMNSAPDERDPVWIENFFFDKEPFFRVKATTITPALPHGLEDIYPFDINLDGKPEFIGVSIAWPPGPPPGIFRPLQVLQTSTNLTVSNQTTTYFKEAIQMVHPRHIATADFDRNGKMDMIVIGHGTDINPFPGEQSLLLLGQADGSLKNATSTNLPVANDFTHHVSVGDIDGDNDMDIYMANIHGGTNGPRFYINNGNGVFTVGTNNLPVIISNKNNGVYTSSTLNDLDKDGDLDLFLGGDEARPNNLVLLNNGVGQFVLSQNPVSKRPTATWITVAQAVADFDDDGDLDIICSNTPGNPFYGGAFLQLLLNDGKANFTDASERISQKFSSAGWVKWIDVIDLNNDGIKDLLLTSNGGINNSIFIGVGNARFKQSPVQLPPSDGPLRTSDVDEDGDQDLVSVLGNTAYIGENVQFLAYSTANINLSGTINICEGSPNKPLLSTTLKANNTYAWLKNGIIIPNATTASYQVAGPGKYQVVVRHLDYPADTSLIADVILNPLPTAPTVATAANCGPAALTLTAAGGSAGNYRWYTTATGGTAIANATGSTYTTPNLTATTTYYVAIINGSCESSRTSVTATINPVPNSPTVTAAVSYCQNATAGALTAAGTGLKWYTSATGGTSSATAPLPVTTTVGNTSYYVSQTVNGCESSRATITVTVNANPTASFAAFSTNTICSTVTNFTLTGGQPAGGSYSGTGVSNGLFNASIAGPGPHTINYSVTQNGCTATASQTIHITTCTGVNEISELAKSLLIYPNPTNSKFYIFLPLPAKTDVTVRLANMKGSILVQEKYAKRAGDFLSSFDLSKEAKGVYNLQIITDKEVINKQLVVQ